MGIVEAAAMKPDSVRNLLESMAAGRVSVQEAEARLAHLPFEDLGFARVDHHRAVRGVGPEVVYARSKTPEQVAAIASALLRREGAPVLVTRPGTPTPARSSPSIRKPAGTPGRACWCCAAPSRGRGRW